MKLPKELITVTPLSKVLASILFIALPFIGFSLGMQYQQTLNQVKQSQITTNARINLPTPTPDPTANWKTYTGVNIKISFKVPVGWLVQERDGDIYDGKKINTTINIYDPKNKMSLSIVENFRGSPGGVNQVRVNDIEIGGVKTKKYYSAEDTGVDTEPIQFQIPLDTNGKEYFIVADIRDNEADKIFDQILSTFKLTESP